MEAITNFLNSTGFAKLGENPLQLVMLAVSCVLLYLAIVKKFEPLLLLPIAFGMLLTNLPGAGIYHAELFEGGHVHWEMFAEGVKLANGSTEAVGLLDVLYLGVKLGVYPCLIFIGVGCMTDFGPLIANPKSLLLGAAAQLGIFVTYVGAVLLGFTPATRPAPSASSAVQTALRPSLSPPSSHLNSLARSPLPHIPTWRSFRLFSRRS